MTLTMALRTKAPLNSQQLTAIWSELNARHFNGALPPIDLVWSRRLTSSVGMFVSRAGPAFVLGSERLSQIRTARDPPLPSPPQALVGPYGVWPEQRSSARSRTR